MKKKKIFIYIHQSIIKGGVEKVFSNLINNLPKDKYDITVLSYVAYLTNDIYKEIYPKNVKRRWLFYDEFSHNWLKRLQQRAHNWLMPRIYPKVVRFHRFDTAIAAQEGMYAKFVEESISAERKLVWIHNDMRLCHWTAKCFGSTEAEAECYRTFDKVICVSNAVAESMRETFGEMANLHVCYNPIDTLEIDRKLYQLTIDRPAELLFVAVGRLVEQKGFDRLLRICAKLNAQGYKYVVWILGDGEEREKLQKEIFDNGLNNVHLLGNQSNPFPYMKVADWLVCASRHEGFNMVLYEAAWCGTPSITTDNAGTREFLGDSEFGIVTENDESELYEAMKKVMDSPEIRDHYQKKVQERRKFMSLSQRLEEIEKIL